MSGNHEHSHPPGEKPSIVPGGELERGRAISGSPPPTDDLDSEWDSSPADAAAEKPSEKPSVRPAAVVVRTNPPPPMTVAAGTDAGNTLLGVAPPAVASRAVKAVGSPIPPAAAVAAEARALSSAPPKEVPPTEEPAPEKPKQEPSAEAKPKSEPALARAEKSEAPSEPEVVAAKAPAKAVPAARARELSSSPDSVAASSSDRRAGETAEEPVHIEPRRSNRGLWIAAAAAVVIFGLWYGLRSPAGDESAKTEISPPAELAQVSKAAPAPADPAAQRPTEPVAASAEPAAAAPATSAAPAAPPSSADPLAPPADGKKIVIVKVRPADARFYYRGKKMGGSPMRVELAPGEKRAFEVGHPSFVTRKVVIDGSEPEVTVGLQPKSASALPQPKGPAGEPAEGLP